VQRLDIPLEYLESIVLTRVCPPLTSDDLLDFALMLEGAEDIVGAAVAD
jgi:hypothetical protein